MPSFRRAPPRPASRGLVRPRCHVGLCGYCRRRRCRRRQRTGGVGSLAQPPECEDNDHPVRAEPGGSPKLPCRRAARGRPPSAPSLGLRAPEERRDAASVTAGSRPCHPEWDRVLAHRQKRRPWTLHPTGYTMSSGQQPPRRVTNVGSLLLTPQENESLFSFLGKKCVVSVRDPCSQPPTSPGWFGLGDSIVGGRRGRARHGWGAAAGQAASLPGPGASRTLLPGCRPARPGATSPSCLRTRECHLRRPAQKPRSAGPGPCPCCRFKLSSRPQGDFLRASTA